MFFFIAGFGQHINVGRAISRGVGERCRQTLTAKLGFRPRGLMEIVGNLHQHRERKHLQAFWRIWVGLAEVGVWSFVGEVVAIVEAAGQISSRLGGRSAAGILAED